MGGRSSSLCHSLPQFGTSPAQCFVCSTVKILAGLGSHAGDPLLGHQTRNDRQKRNEIRIGVSRPSFEAPATIGTPAFTAIKITSAVIAPRLRRRAYTPIDSVSLRTKS